MMYFLAAVIVVGIVVLVLIAKFGPHKPNKLNKSYFHGQWAQLLERVKTPEGMILAVIDADKLLDEALKKRHYKGKTMGERLVSAQRSLTSNDNVWFAHKLRNRLVHEPNAKLGKRDAQNALEGFKQALKDLGAL